MTQIAAVEADELLVWHLLFTSGLHGERLIVVACALVEFESDSQENIYTYEYCIHIHIVFVAEIISPHNVFKEEAIRSLCCKFQFKSNVFALTSLLYELMTTRNEMTKIIIRTIDQIPFFFLRENLQSNSYFLLHLSVKGHLNCHATLVVSSIL